MMIMNIACSDFHSLSPRAARVIEIFELFEAERRPLKISEIVERLRVPQSSVSTLMETLIAQGFMDFAPETRQLRLRRGWRFSAIGRSAHRTA